MRRMIAGLAGLHGPIHPPGLAKTSGWADLPRLTERTSRPMGLVWLALGTAILGAVPAPVSGQDSVPSRAWAGSAGDSALVSDLVTMIPTRMEADGVPGLNVLVLRRGQVAWRASFGWADTEANRPMTPDAVFRVESISKPVTAWGVMKLAEEGELDLDVPLQDQLRSFTLPPEIPPFTPRQLLSHTAGVGLGDYTDRHAPEGPRPTLEESLARELVMIGAPGGGFAYSDTGYNLLELLVQDRAGSDFADWMDRRVLDPLDMTEAGYDWDPGIRDRVPTAHTLRGVPVEPYVYPGRGSGGLFATLEDIGRFVRASSPEVSDVPAAEGEDQRVLADSSIALLHTPVVRPRGLYGIVAEGYALGHFTENLSDGRLAVWHGGQGYGWMTHFHLIPESGDAIVLLANSQRAWPLFAHVLRAWSESLGVEPVLMTRIAWAAPLAWSIIGLFLAFAAVLVTATIRRRRRRGRAGGRSGRRIPIRILALAAGVLLLGAVAWASAQEYLFLFSILPSTTGWLGLAAVILAMALMVWAALPTTEDARVGSHPGGAGPGVTAALLVGLLWCAHPVVAQEALIHLEGGWLPASNVTRSLSGPATEAEVRLLRGSLLVPLVLQRGRLVVVPRISASRVGVEPKPIDPVEPVWVEALYDVDVEVLAQAELADRTRLSVVLAPGVASDFHALRAGHLTLQGAALLTRQTEGGPTWGGGVSVTNAFGEVRVVPLLTFQWAFEHARIDVLAPAEGRILWTPGARIALGVQSMVDGNVYGLGREGTLEGGRVRYSLADVGPVVRYDIGGRLRLAASAGVSFLRRLEVEDAQGREVEDAALSRGWRAGLAISWLLPSTVGAP